ncbi:MAG TPA: L-seryl-tRNA(Sec) selenium transferase [bacterium]|nr:L-seryl-tRNA(Sec) selenium transferase [bacterium]
MQEALRQIPSVDQVLGSAAVRELLDAEPRPIVVRAIRAALDAVRAEVRARNGAAGSVPPLETIAADVAERVRTRPRGLRRVLNATGIVLHTNLGRARLAEEAVRALVESAPGACDLELDLETGRRGSRTARVERRLRELTGAEAAFVVNNNAAALVLALNELAQGREAVVSRGELVEIGGSFRLPDVMLRTGAKLVEVGTTNRTHLRDYEAAIGPDTALLLKVHRSNFRQDGFVAEPSLGELVELGARHGVPVLHDLGSGLLHPMAATRDEPRLTDSLRAGVDVVTMSGDKLLGGPQAGILLGKSPVLDRLRKNPLARAVRVDKFTIAALAATLDLLEDADRARARIPVLRALEATPEELAARASAIAGDLAGCPELHVREVETVSEVGGGAVPAEGLPTTAVALRHRTLSADELAAELRGLELPVIGRIADGEVRLDPRSLDPAEDAECARVIRSRFSATGTGRRGEG